MFEQLLPFPSKLKAKLGRLYYQFTPPPPPPPLPPPPSPMPGHYTQGLSSAPGASKLARDFTVDIQEKRQAWIWIRIKFIFKLNQTKIHWSVTQLKLNVVWNVDPRANPWPHDHDPSSLSCYSKLKPWNGTVLSDFFHFLSLYDIRTLLM